MANADSICFGRDIATRACNGIGIADVNIVVPGCELTAGSFSQSDVEAASGVRRSASLPLAVLKLPVVLL